MTLCLNWVSATASWATGIRACYGVEWVHGGPEPSAGAIRLRYEDEAEFYLSPDGSALSADWPATSSVEDAMCYLLGPVMGRVLQLRGIPTLHGCAVAIDGRAVVFIGACGAGKSTTAAAFAKLGYPVLTEDIVAFTNDLLVQPGYPLIRLWPASVELLFGAPDALPLLTPTWDKRYLDLNQPGYRFQDQPLPLGAVYVLTGREGVPRVEALGRGEALMHLVANGYTSHLPGDDAYRKKEFLTFGRIAASVPVMALYAGDVFDTCRLIAQ